MIQVKPNQALPIETQLFDGATGKIVKAVVKELDGTVLAASLVLADIGGGSYANQSFNMPAGVEFAMAVITVYQGDGITPDTAYSVIAEDYGIIFPIIAKDLVVQILCAGDDSLTSPHRIRSVKTSNLNLVLKMLDENGNPMDITGATNVKFRLKKTDGTALEKDFTSGLYIMDAKAGTVFVPLLPADLGECDAGDNSVEIELDLGGETHVRIVEDILDLQDSLFE